MKSIEHCAVPEMADVHLRYHADTTRAPGGEEEAETVLCHACLLFKKKKNSISMQKMKLQRVQTSDCGTCCVFSPLRCHRKFATAAARLKHFKGTRPLFFRVAVEGAKVAAP